MTQAVTLTAATNGTLVGFRSATIGDTFGSVSPASLYSSTVLQLTYDATADQLVLTLAGEHSADDFMNLILTDSESGQQNFLFASATVSSASAPTRTVFTWAVADGTTLFANAGVYEVVLNPIGFNCECDDTTGFSTLQELRERMMVRLGFAAQVANPPPGMEALLNDFLQSAQRFLYQKYPGVRQRIFTWTMLPYVRYYDLDDNDESCTKKLNALKRSWVGIEDTNGTWYELADGIPPEFYTSVQNPGLPTRYEIRQCIEVFPAPDVSYRLRIKGHFELQSFSSNTDATTIDSELVFLWALANAKAHYNKPDAGEIASQAREYLGTLVGDSHGTNRYVPRTRPRAPWTKPVMRDGYDG